MSMKKNIAAIKTACKKNAISEETAAEMIVYLAQNPETPDRSEVIREIVTLSVKEFLSLYTSEQRIWEILRIKQEPKEPKEAQKAQEEKTV